MTKESSASPRERGVCVEGGVIKSRRQYSSSEHCYWAWIHPAASRCLGMFLPFACFTQELCGQSRFWTRWLLAVADPLQELCCSLTSFPPSSGPC